MWAFFKRELDFPDKNQLFQEYKIFLANWDQRRFLEQNNVDLVLLDISQLPFETAESLGIPSVGISNFSCYTAYQGLINENELAIFKEAYKKMTHFFCISRES